MKIDGREISSQILEDLKKRVEKLKEKNVIPHLYIILLSNDVSSESYVKQKMLKGEQIGVKITVDRQSFDINTQELIEKIEKLNNDNLVHGIIVQRPMPESLNEKEIQNAVIGVKDVDGFNPNSKFEVPVSSAILKILKTTHPDNFDNWLKEQRITVLGKGLTAGGPIINTLIKSGIVPEVITSKSEGREKILKKSDIVISAVGKPNVLDESNLKQGVILIGVGLHKEDDGKFHGDFNEEKVQNKTLFYSPTPGGVGPVNVAMLLSNLVKATEIQI
jgi:methylenetetrahydrofolate dehydrogenase (NADP+)/methenyltetrahydrofolate cyclohydrolase